MDALLSLNSSAQIREAYYKKFSDLPTGSYTVKRFHLKETNFGLRLLVEIEDFYLTLPQRFSEKINTQEQVKEINRGKWRLAYGGKDIANYNKLKIDFNTIVEQNAQQLPGDDDEEVPVIVMGLEDEDEMPAQRAKRQADGAGRVTYPSKRNRL